MDQENNLNNLAPVAAVAVAATVTKPLNDEKPVFTRNVSIHDARANKIFGTMKATRIHPNARPKINIYEENGEQMHQMTKGVVKTVSLHLAPKIYDFFYRLKINFRQPLFQHQLLLQQQQLRLQHLHQPQLWLLQPQLVSPL